MLSTFVQEHRHEIIARCQARVESRMAGHATKAKAAQGVAMFLSGLEQALATEPGGGASAALIAAGRHGGELLRDGFTVAQVVHDYGDACQTITELAIERNTAITTAEFRQLNGCLDNAIAEAVTEYERQHELDVIADDVRRANQRLGFLAHELRNQLASALLAFEVLRGGSVGIRGSTGDVLGRSLVGLRDLVDRSLAEVRLAAGITRLERIPVAQLIEEIELSAQLGAKAHGVELTVAGVEPEIVVEADRQILASVLANLLQNACKYTRPHGRVWLHVRTTADRVLFEVEDQCGGLPAGKSENLFEPFDQRSSDRTGLGLGLAICARGVAALHGEIRVRNQNRGCVFTVELPRGPAAPA